MHAEGKLSCRYVQQFRRRVRFECGEPQLRQSRGVECRAVPVARGGQKDDRIGLQPAGYKSEHIRRCTIEPVRILRDENQRRVRGDLGHQVENRHRNAEMLGRRTVSEAERRVERSTLSRR